ncbi:MAG: hypothetical protein U0894_10005 [Pirellulales bacterium]
MGTAWGKKAVAVACGEGVTLDYQKSWKVSPQEDQIEVEVKVWNASLSNLEVLGVSSPCPACIKIDGVPATIPRLATHTIIIHLPVRQMEVDTEVPLKFQPPLRSEGAEYGV